MFDWVKKLLGSSNDAEVKKLQKTVNAVEALEDEYKALTDEQLRAKTDEFRARLQNGETEDDILPEAFAAIREADARVLGMRPYRVQVMGGLVLHQGRIAEMKTGEGKTLVSTLPAYLNALSGKGVHVVTVNDYLARRDSEWMGKVHRFMGLSVGLIVHDLDSAERRAAYACDITYGTNNELGFDYLRDNMVIRQSELVQRGHNFAIVDEVDSILIDEARTPLIISGAGDKSTDLYARVDAVVRTLKRDVHFEIEEKKKAISLTDEGAQRVEAAFGITNINDAENAELNHHVSCALRANFLMKRDVDYVVKDDQVIIVDEFTGRLMIGRRYSEGLHQAIEAKEHVTIERESRTLATITFQNYFRMYHKLSGMTGTAKTEEDEFQNIYSLDVVQIPTNKPNIRKDLDDMVYKTKKAKFNAVVDAIAQVHANGQPVLVGTVTVETSEMLSAMLQRRGIQHEVLNAKNHAKEAEIVAQAGHWAPSPLPPTWLAAARTFCWAATRSSLPAAPCVRTAMTRKSLKPRRGTRKMCPTKFSPRAKSTSPSTRTSSAPPTKRMTACCKPAVCTSSARNAMNPAALTISCAAVRVVRATPVRPSSLFRWRTT